MRCLPLLGALLLSASPAHADEAARSTRGVSVSVTLEAEAMAPLGPVGVLPGGGASLRLHAGGFFASAGLLVWPNFFNPSLGSVTLESRLGLGYRFVLARRVALTPTARAGLWHALALGKLGGLVLGVELPVTVFLGRGLFLEPFAFGGGFLSYSVGPLVSVGLRVGWHF